MRFFIDNCLSPTIANALAILCKDDDSTVSHLREKFSAATSDVDWISALAAEKDWVLISGDTRIIKRPHERAIWRESGLTLFVFSKGWTEEALWEQAWRLIRWWPHIVRQAERNPINSGFEIRWKQKVGRFQKII